MGKKLTQQQKEKAIELAKMLGMKVVGINKKLKPTGFGGYTHKGHIVDVIEFNDWADGNKVILTQTCGNCGDGCGQDITPLIDLLIEQSKQ